MEHKPIERTLPPYIYGREAGENEKVWTEAAVLAVVAAERERCLRRALQVVGWHINDYNRSQIQPVYEELVRAMPRGST